MRDEEDDDVRGGPGWFAALLGAGILVLAGFAVGVVVGAVREEPAMLLQYVTGRTADLPAPRPGVDAVAPVPVRAAPAEPAAPEEEEPFADAPPPVEAAAPAAIAPSQAADGEAPPSRPAPPVVATGPREVAAVAPSAGLRFAVQVGAFSQSSEAERLEAQLKRKGLPVYVQPSTGDRDSRWRVRVGPLPTRAEADRVAARLKSQDKLPVWILEDSGT